ncbi:hypothetical protein [Chloroflexus sp.]|uniref:hypothetical protein n=1 Tax=Chloroflexus sp. TaxID=1904827 RepID=UPI002ACDFBCD|nr:hypothetical protein [Chloroflexus sp.]
MTDTTLIQPEAQASLRSTLAAAHEAVAAAQERLAELAVAVQQAEADLHRALVDAARGSALADYDPTLLQAFF